MTSDALFQLGMGSVSLNATQTEEASILRPVAGRWSPAPSRGVDAALAVWTVILRQFGRRRKSGPQARLHNP